ncbi:di-N-acetylchitobiase [Takifugu rubripes]|uniref:Di-N-acetylchitobiase n=1 Tax=Takifugu rubripes TaxID=31033 RepID=H2V6F7_TAKRU|nr:di-N-acetylchitobiase [Takifugu rubripes]|eukprot:XP_003974294.2 PREDICTED: di-N-acetylchitobiase [Takifugu rubripes]
MALNQSVPTRNLWQKCASLSAMFWALVCVSCTVWVSRAAVCPCDRPELCQHIRTDRDFEVFVFDVGGKTWKSYNWSMVTTLAMFGKYDAELVCYAHSKGARVVLKGDVPLSFIVDQENRTAWIKEKVNLAKTQFMDGINIDIEQAVAEGSPEYHALTALVKETTEAFHREIPGSQVSFDVAWSPNCIDKRCYDYVNIANSCDLLFVMSYDEQSQIQGECIARANAPLAQTLKGYDQYLKLKIDPSKIVMGLPWYGYDYQCLHVSQEGKCSIEKVPFRGAPCSDAAGTQKTYKWIMKQVDTSLSGRVWDDSQQAPYFNYKHPNGQIHQVWYDDPQSICPKAEYVKTAGLRGIGMWNGNSLDYSDEAVARQQTGLMWNALFGC